MNSAKKPKTNHQTQNRLVCQTTLTVHNYNVCGCCWYCCGRHFGPFLVTPVKVVSFICAALFCWPLFRQHVILKGRRKPNFRVGETGLTYFSLLEKKQKKSSVVICTRFYCPSWHSGTCSPLSFLSACVTKLIITFVRLTFLPSDRCAATGNFSQLSPFWSVAKKP